MMKNVSRHTRKALWFVPGFMLVCCGTFFLNSHKRNQRSSRFVHVALGELLLERLKGRYKVTVLYLNIESNC